jgi:putative thiamine transport system permease protein
LPAAWTLAHWSSELPYSGPSLWHSVVLALASSSVALALVMASLEYQHQQGRRWPLFLVVLPLLLPQLPMMFGLQVATVLAGWDTRYGIVVWGHLLFVFPYVYLCLQATWFAYDERYVQVARSMGHGRFAAWWRIKLPMLLRPVLFSWAVGFAVSVAQFLPTLMLGGGRVATITTEAVAIGSGVDRRLAAIYALLQLALPALAYGAALLLPRMLVRVEGGPDGAILLKSGISPSAWAGNGSAAISPLRWHPARC